MGVLLNEGPSLPMSAIEDTHNAINKGTQNKYNKGHTLLHTMLLTIYDTKMVQGSIPKIVLPGVNALLGECNCAESITAERSSQAPSTVMTKTG